MKIIICDDSIKEAEKTKEVLVSNKLADESDITIFLPDDLRGEIERRTLSCDIAVMDIEFDAVPYNGINLSAAINELLPFSQIIYLTNILEFAPDVYETKHCYFVLKSNMDLMLPRAVNKAVNIIEKNKNAAVMEIVCDGSRVLIPQHDIVFVERSQRKLTIHTEKSDYSFYSSLKKFLSQTNGLFVRCHEAYVVNLDYVNVVKKDLVQMEGGRELPIGISFEKNFRTRYMNYWADRV